MGKVAQELEANKQEEKQPQLRQSLHELAREGARRMLQRALVSEVQEHVERNQAMRDGSGRAMVVRNGYAAAREIVLGTGPVEVVAPRVDDRGLPQEQRFRSALLPRYARRAPEVTTALPMLYLRGLGTGDFREGLSALLGDKAAGLSASVVTRLTQSWAQEYEEFRKRRLDKKEYVYLWVDGVHLNVRLEEDRLALLVIIGVRVDGTKELVALEDGYRESTESWLAVLRDLKGRGMRAPALVVGDGALGFWKALREVYPSTRGQRCWVHKMCNVLDKLPRRLQGRAKAHLRRMMYAPDKKTCESEKESFEKEYQKYPKAVESLLLDWDSMVVYYDFPFEHFKHLRTTNPIESTFATLRHRQRRTKGNGSRAAALAMAYKLLDSAQQGWRKLDCAIMLLWIHEGVKCKDGMPECSLEELRLRQRQAISPTLTAQEVPTQATP
jgi:transposase-like protein